MKILYVSEGFISENSSPRNPWLLILIVSKLWLGNNSLPDVFKGRFVGFGTYDINRPDGATHWALVSGKNVDDHLSFVTELQTKHSKKFMKYIEDRGGVELISNFTFENLRFIR